jgi:hypothetical protein
VFENRVLRRTCGPKRDEVMFIYLTYCCHYESEQAMQHAQNESSNCRTSSPQTTKKSRLIRDDNIKFYN